MYKIIYVAKCVTNLLENPQKKSKLDQSNESNKTKIVEAVNSNLIQVVQFTNVSFKKYIILFCILKKPNLEVEKIQNQLKGTHF